MTVILTHEGVTLIQVLGWTDALFWPAREYKVRSWAHIHRARWRYHTQGVPWRSQAKGDNAIEQARSRAIKSLSQHGMLTLVRAKGKGTRVSHVRLTDEGEQAAGALLGTDREYGAIVFCQEARRLTQGERIWIPEIAFNEGRGWGDGHNQELAVIARTADSALMRGLAVSNCDTTGHVGYCLTEAGMACDDEREETIYDEPDRALLELYEESFEEAIAEWRAKDERLQEIGEIPFPGGFLAMPEVCQSVLDADAQERAEKARC